MSNFRDRRYTPRIFSPIMMKIRWALFVPILLSALATFLVFSSEQTELHLQLNSMHPHWADPLFVYGTYLADGVMLLVVAILLLLFNSKRSGLFFSSSAIAASALTQFLKRVPFSDIHRPNHYLSEMPGLHVPEGVELANNFSFPSGHATAAFVMFISLALIFKSKRAAFLFGLLAVFSAYTRVWISMHFMEDILVGAFIGTIGALLFYQLFYGEKMMKRSKLDGPLLKAFNSPAEGL